MALDPHSLEDDREQELACDLDEAEVRFGLTARGEALVAELAETRFRGFGPCAAASSDATLTLALRT